MTQIWGRTDLWLWGLEIEFSEGFRYQIKISYGKRLHYISNKISAKYELQRILVSRFPCGTKLSEHFAKKNEAHIFCRFGACSSNFELFAANQHAAHPFEATRPSFDQNWNPAGSNNGVSHKTAKLHLKVLISTWRYFAATWPKLELPVVQMLPEHPHRPIST